MHGGIILVCTPCILSQLTPLCNWAQCFLHDDRHNMEQFTQSTNSFGGAATICTSEFPFARCINYYAVNDPILNVVPSAVKALKSGFSFGGGMEQEIIFLASRTGDPVTDHGLLNPTYLEALLWEGQRYQSLYLSPLGKAVDGAFVAPLASSLGWFPNFAYETTKKLVLAILTMFIWLREFARSVLAQTFNKDSARYEPVRIS